MAKTKEELDELKKEYETLSSKLSELTEEEITQITGGFDFEIKDDGSDKQYDPHFYKNKV